MLASKFDELMASSLCSFCLTIHGRFETENDQLGNVEWVWKNRNLLYISQFVINDTINSIISCLSGNIIMNIIWRYAFIETI